MSGAPKRAWSSSPVFPNINKRQKMGFSYTGTGTVTKRKKGVRGTRKTFANKVRQIQPAKHLTGESNVTILNGLIYTMNITAQIAQGNGNSQREGDSVFLEALKIEGAIQTSTSSNAYKFRILLGYSGEEYGVTTLTSGNLTQTELFQPSTFTVAANGIINPKAFTCIYDEVIDLNSQIEGDRTIQSFRDTVVLNKRFPYQQSTGVYGKDKNLYMVIISYSSDSPLSDPNGSALVSYDCIFRN